jgi:hypothetical protein
MLIGAMVREKTLVIYKNRPALVLGNEGDKINIAVMGGDSVKVREKDIELLHPGPCTLNELEAPAPEANVREAWELLVDDASQSISLLELSALLYGWFSPRTAWAAWELLKEGLYFTGGIAALKARPRELVEEDERKREEKQRETGDRAGNTHGSFHGPFQRNRIVRVIAPGAVDCVGPKAPEVKAFLVRGRRRGGLRRIPAKAEARGVGVFPDRPDPGREKQPVGFHGALALSQILQGAALVGLAQGQGFHV